MLETITLIDATVWVAIIGAIGTVLVTKMNNKNSEIATLMENMNLMLDQYQEEVASLRREVREERKEKEELRKEVFNLRQEIIKYRKLIEDLTSMKKKSN